MFCITKTDLCEDNRLTVSSSSACPELVSENPSDKAFTSILFEAEKKRGGRDVKFKSEDKKKISFE